jgi:hypothetical protein
MEFDFIIKYIPGHLNVLPDHLSRLYSKVVGDKKVYALRKVLTWVDEESGRLKKKEIFDKHHQFGHFGSKELIDKIHLQGIHWKNLSREAQEYCDSCSICASFNVREKGFHPIEKNIMDVPFRRVAIDFAKPGISTRNGNKVILVIVDYMSRFTILKALPDETSRSVAEALVETFCYFGYPLEIKRDNAKDLTSDFIKELFKMFKVVGLNSVEYYPQSNSIVERRIGIVMKTLKKSLSTLEMENWDVYLPFVAMFINNKLNNINKTQPFNLMFGRQLVMGNNRQLNQLDEVNEEDLEAATKEFENKWKQVAKYVFPDIFKLASETQRLNEKRNEKHHTITDFKIGELVYVMTHEFANYKTKNLVGKVTPVYHGPYLVKGYNKRNNTYKMVEWIFIDSVREEGNLLNSIPPVQMKKFAKPIRVVDDRSGGKKNGKITKMFYLVEFTDYQRYWVDEEVLIEEYESLILEYEELMELKEIDVSE